MVYYTHVAKLDSSKFYSVRKPRALLNTENCCPDEPWMSGIKLLLYVKILYQMACAEEGDGPKVLIRPERRVAECVISTSTNSSVLMRIWYV